MSENREHIAALAMHYSLPAMYDRREYAMADALMSYGGSILDLDYQIGVYVGRILNGEKPADLSVVRSARYQLIINLKTAKALGLTVPSILLAFAHEVIE